MKAFGEQGAGVFVGPTAISEEIRRQYRVQPIGGIDAVRERFYAISYERRIERSRRSWRSPKRRGPGSGRLTGC